MEKGKSPVSRGYLYMTMAGALLSGTSNTLFAKIADETESAGELYRHPFLQTFFMFAGEYFCFLLSLLKSTFSSSALTHPLSHNSLSPAWFAIPASLDLCASSLIFISLTMIDASVYQMLRGLIVITTPILSMCFIGRKQYRHHWLGTLLILAGVALVGYCHVVAT
jgi:drug/metabolite transporter (DMT)-like permease